MLLETAAGGEARVVNVVSKLHERGRNEGLDGHLTPYDSWAAYGTSKLALVHEAAEIERRYGDRGVHGYSLHPGARQHPHRRPRSGDRAGARAGCASCGAARAAGARHAAGGRADHGVLRDLAGGRARWLPPRGHAAEPSPDALDAEAARLLWDATDRWLASS